MDFRVSKKNKLALCCCRRHHLQLYIYTRLTSRRLDVRKPYAARSRWLARAVVSLLMSSCSLRSGPMRLRLVNWSYVDDKRAATRRRRRYHGKVTRQVVGNKILDDALQLRACLQACRSTRCHLHYHVVRWNNLRASTLTR